MTMSEIGIRTYSIQVTDAAGAERAVYLGATSYALAGNNVLRTTFPSGGVHMIVLGEGWEVSVEVESEDEDA